MAQPSSIPNTLGPDFDRRVVLSPTRSGTAAPAACPPARVSTSFVGQVVVLEVAGRLGEVVGQLDRAIQLALADGPRGLVCDLSAVVEGAEQTAVEVLATAARHVRAWPGIPLAVACPEPRVREALAAHPLSVQLIVTDSMPEAVSEVLASPIPDVAWLRIAPHPTAPRASRDFVARTLQDWGLGSLVLSVGLVMSELVAISTMDASTDIDLSMARNLGALRLTVRDNIPDLRRQPYSHLDARGQRLSVVAVLSRAFGVLPTADGGKVTWAVLNATPSSASRRG